MNTMNEFNQQRIAQTIQHLKQNNIDAFYIESKEKLITYLDRYILKGMTVSVGGSMTLFETGTISYLKQRTDIHYLDRYQDQLSQDKMFEIFRQALSCDVYLTSSNAITMDGYLYNVDRTGNRLAALTFGPQKVIVVAGTNKLVKDLTSAKMRVEQISAPANCLRLGKQTPCTKKGYCVHCQHDDKLCSFYLVTGHQHLKNRITVLILNGDYGF